jgi:hypothetical protein
LSLDNTRNDGFATSVVSRNDLYIVRAGFQAELEWQTIISL